MDKNKISSIVFNFAILAIIISFNFSNNPPSGWYQQFLPNLNNNLISDIIFIDSLNGFGVTDNNFSNDTGYIIKTTNGGDNWNIVFIDNRDYKAIAFIDLNTGYVCGAKPSSGSRLLKTTNSGLNWFNVNPPDPFLVLDDMSVLNEDTIWLASDGTAGGVFRTTNGGTNWIRQSSAGDPDKIYMFNSRIGFIGFNGGTPTTRKTTNGGFNWFTVLNEGFSDIQSVDSLTGWKARGSMKKSTDGGLTWITQTLPSGGNIAISEIIKFSILNSDTLWGVGAVSNLIRGLIYISTDGGTTWNYQLPDTSIHIPRYYHVQFINKQNGWAYSIGGGVHTVSGGNTTSISQISSAIPSDFKLYQNYPNPFNPRTVIPFSLKKKAVVRMYIYDITGKEIQRLVVGDYNAGEYEVDFMGKYSSSGVYFYRIEITGDSSNEKFTETRRMILLK